MRWTYATYATLDYGGTGSRQEWRRCLAEATCIIAHRASRIGYRLVPAILERLGFSNVTLVEEQCVPDGNFPTLEYPNPEDPSAFDLAIKTAEGLAARGRRPLLLWLPIRTVTGLGHASGTETDTNSLPATSSACFWSTLWWLTV